MTRLRRDPRGERALAAVAGRARPRFDLAAKYEGRGRPRIDPRAEAEGQRANLLAEAEGKQRLAEALNAYDAAAIQLTLSQLFIQHLPQMIEGAAKPLGQIDRLTIIDSGGGNGGGPLQKLSSTVPTSVFTFLESFQAVTGIDLKGMVEAAAKDAGSRTGGAPSGTPPAGGASRPPDPQVP